ncbi:MAG: hypothetical protein ABEJ83_03115 [Candidatus Nanohaloarchaea archaeon]
MVKIWMVFEAVGPDKKGVEKSMEDHVESIEAKDGCEILERESGELEEMEDPHPGLDKGFSQVLELEIEFKDFYQAIETVINYGPTYVQFEEPDSYDLELKEAQDVLQRVTNMMHQYAQMGAGGVLVSRSGSEES